MRSLYDGLITGLFLQLALGPVFFYILGITINSSYINSLSAIAAVTLADYLFIVLSLIGVGRLLEDGKKKTVFTLVSSLLLVLFGLGILYNGLYADYSAGRSGAIVWTPFKSFMSSFALTMSSPLTIVFWGSIFSAKAMEKNYRKKQLMSFGFGAGASTFLFLAFTMMLMSSFRSAIPTVVVQVLNGTVGLLLVAYGITRTAKSFSSETAVRERREPE